jgi:DNA repair protein RadA/Sms
VGLLGELRSVTGLERRLREAARIGFDLALVPRPGRGSPPFEVPGLRVVEVATLREAVEAALTERPHPHGEALPAMLG